MAGEIFNEIERSKTFDDKGVAKYTRTFRVTEVSPTAAFTSVEALLGISWGDAHPENSLALCKGVKHQILEATVWDVTYDYDSGTNDTNKGTHAPGSLSTNPSSPNQNGQNTTPESRPWVVTYEGVTVDDFLVEDRATPPNKVLNAAGLPFETGLVAPGNRIKIHIKSYRSIGAVSPPVHILAYQNKVNSSAYLGFPTRTLRVEAPKFTSQYEHGAWFYEQDTTLEFKPDLWNPVKVANVSTMVRESAIKPFKQIVDRTGHPVTTPVPISADGTRALNAGEDIIYLEFYPYYETNFALLI